MLSRLAIWLAVLPLILGLTPGTVTFCVCTGQVVTGSVAETELCQSHRLPQCGKCLPSKKNGCFAKSSNTLPPALTTDSVHFEIPAILAPAAEPPVAQLSKPVCKPKICLLLPRIREPDSSGHPLRAPPRFV